MQIQGLGQAFAYTKYQVNHEKKTNEIVESDMCNQTEKNVGDIKTTFSKLLEQNKSEFVEKLKKGETEPTFQIGAQNFTEKEWNKLIERIDKIEEETQKLHMKEMDDSFD